MAENTNAGDAALPTEPLDHTGMAVTAMLAAAAAADGGEAPDFAAWLSHILARVAAMRGGIDALVAGRPGSWESDKVRDFVLATAGDRPGDLEAFLPDGFRVPLGSAALYESADNTLWLVTRPWNGTEDHPATVYVRSGALPPGENIYTQGRGWLVDQTPINPFQWRELGAGDVAEAFAHVGAEMHEGQPAPGRLLGTLYRDMAASYDGGVYFDVPDRNYLHSRPLAVQRFCQTDHAAQLENDELDAVGAVLDELAVLAGEHDAGDLADGVTFGVDVDNRDSVSLLYALALGLARLDEAKYVRAQQLKFDYEAWWTRWRNWYTDAQLAGVSPLGQ